jgi:hypothetical protein
VDLSHSSLQAAGPTRRRGTNLNEGGRNANDHGQNPPPPPSCQLPIFSFTAHTKHTARAHTKPIFYGTHEANIFIYGPLIYHNHTAHANHKAWAGPPFRSPLPELGGLKNVKTGKVAATQRDGIKTLPSQSWRLPFFNHPRPWFRALGDDRRGCRNAYTYTRRVPGAGGRLIYTPYTCSTENAFTFTA